jgi:hypothetical protein
MSRGHLRSDPAHRRLTGSRWSRVSIALITWTALCQTMLAQTGQSDPFEPTVGEIIWGSVRENKGTALSEMRWADSPPCPARSGASLSERCAGSPRWVNSDLR